MAIWGDPEPGSQHVRALHLHILDLGAMFGHKVCQSLICTHTHNFITPGG
jgi:hypothetical protein